MSYKLEICANSIESGIIAQNAGAHRIELCDNLLEGGTTPSYAQIAMAKSLLKIEVWPIIRPRGGDFYYSEIEFEIMKKDIECCKSLKCDGVVFGLLNADGSIDKVRNQILVDLAKPMPATFHRAFDRCSNLEKGLEDIIQLGFIRVLSSGGKINAIQGAKKLAELIQLANNRITIMPGAGINSRNLSYLKTLTGALEYHTTAKLNVISQMKYQNNLVEFGPNDNQYSQSDPLEIEALLAILKT